MLLGAVVAGLAVLGDHKGSDQQVGEQQGPRFGAVPDLHRVEQYLRAALQMASSWAPDRGEDVIRAVTAACEHLRAGELLDASLALHAARPALIR